MTQIVLGVIILAADNVGLSRLYVLLFFIANLFFIRFLLSLLHLLPFDQVASLVNISGHLLQSLPIVLLLLIQISFEVVDLILFLL